MRTKIYVPDDIPTECPLCGVRTALQRRHEDHTDEVCINPRCRAEYEVYNYTEEEHEL